MAAGLALGAQAAYEATIEAPNGVGNVAALTNALTYVNTVLTDPNADRSKMRIWLQPGVYDLSGIYMKTASHLYIAACQHGMIAGLGDGPEDTVLLGGGEAEAHRVLALDGGGNYGWMNVSNLTVTGGYWTGNGGGISANGTTLYSNLIVTNNYAGSSGGGCYLGRAVGCYFANNTAGYGGGLYTSGGGGQEIHYIQGAWNCTFATNSATESGGGLYLIGKCFDCTFLGNKAGNGGGICVGQKNYSWSGFSDTTEIECGTFVDNASSKWGHGAVLYYRTEGAFISVSDCTFSANHHDFGGNGIVYGMELSDCVFTNNFAKEHLVHTCNLSGCLIASNSTSAANQNAYGLIRNSHLSSCTISNNVPAEYLARASTFEGCTLTLNRTTGSANGGLLHICEITNSTIQCHIASRSTTYDCNLYGCLFLNNTNTYASTAIDASSTDAGHTNVNCLFKGNVSTSYGQISSKKFIANCTYIGNASQNGGNYGGICTRCSMWNTVLEGNTFGTGNGVWKQDIRAHNANGNLPLVMTNCVFGTCDSDTTLDADGFVTNDGVANTRKIADMKFEDAANGNYTPRWKSAACNAGCREPWLLALVGESDLAGNARVFGDGIDIGAYECQKNPPGFAFSIR